MLSCSTCSKPRFVAGGNRTKLQCRNSTRRSTAASQSCVLYDCSQELVPYTKAWDFQKQLVERLIEQTAGHHDDGDAVRSGQGNSHKHAVIILQHHPVYTLGSGSTLDNVHFNIDNPPHPLHRTERGGEVTYHGPGQLVLYPVLDLRTLRQDLHWYLRSLEEVVILALDRVSGLQGERIPDLTGVWVDGGKVAAIGVRARKWVTYHGLALNVSPDLTPFSLITPCGIQDKPVQSVLQLVHGDGAPMIADPYSAIESAAAQELLLEYKHALLEALEEVFGLELQPAAAPWQLLDSVPAVADDEGDDVLDPFLVAL